jgi:small subunit ribosomal protein S20
LIPDTYHLILPRILCSIRGNMANTSSAKKAQRAAQRRRLYNLRRSNAVKGAVKEIGKAISAKSASAASVLPKLQKAIDKAVKGGTLHRNTAARMKSRIAKKLAALSK